MSDKNPNIYSQYERFYRTGLILDTGPLILLLAGKYDADSIGKYSLTYEYTREDYYLLLSFISKFRSCIITPHVLTETYNRINTKVEKSKFSGFMIRILNDLKNLEEIHIPKNDILDAKEAVFCGVTDTGILLGSQKDDYLILTKDFKFSQLCSSKNVTAIHFDQLRADSWYS